MLLKLIQAGAIVALFTGSAFAQSSDSAPVGIPLKIERPPTQDEIDKQKAADRAYNAAIDKIPDKKSSSDPWGNIRQPSPTASKNKTQ
jgi:hypothetical protein